MDVISWTPDQPLGARAATAQADPRIYEPLFRARSIEGELPPDLQDALKFCTRAQQVRSDLRRDVLDIEGVVRDVGERPQPASHARFRPDVTLLTAEMKTIALASADAATASRAYRALIRVLLRQKR